MEKTAQPAESACGDVSTVLPAWTGGDQNALDTLTPVVYDELRPLAWRYMRRERLGHIVRTMPLVSDAYMRPVVNGERTTGLVAPDKAMMALVRLDPHKMQVVEMRLFGGLCVEETPEVLNVSPVTEIRDGAPRRPGSIAN